MRLLPYDFCDKLGFSRDLTAAQALAARSANGTRGLHANPDNFRTVIPLFRFADERMTELILKPVELGFSDPLSTNGLPRGADESNTEIILERLQKISAPYGTGLKMSGNNIKVIL